MLPAVIGGKCGQHSHWMLVWVNSSLDPKHALSFVDPLSYYNLYMILPGYKSRGVGDCSSLAQYDQAYSRWMGLVDRGWLPSYERGAPIINPLVGEVCQLWLATHIGEGNTDFKPMAREPCWHCPSLLDHGS